MLSEEESYLSGSGPPWAQVSGVKASRCHVTIRFGTGLGQCKSRQGNIWATLPEPTSQLKGLSDTLLSHTSIHSAESTIELFSGSTARLGHRPFDVPPP